ncbi:DUF669 domain-containing protein [Companilactobacillus formosensis]|uniref:DUF669 domain-containing protein n=2 Tax=Companilactobacillus formosensis TaxID=1617889 RepID=UPI000E65B5E9|nr:DUF669 domain-containing protein [Companilactobacillus formosensis]
MRFTTNYSKMTESNNNSNEPMPAGYYEAKIVDVIEGQPTPSGKEKIQVHMQIRDDLDQALPKTNGKQHRRYIWGDIWFSNGKNHDKEYMLQPESCLNLLKAAGYPEGTPFENTAKSLDTLVGGKAVKIKVGINEYNGKKSNEVAFWDYYKTDYPMDPNQSKPVDVKESDLPF